MAIYAYHHLWSSYFKLCQRFICYAEGNFDVISHMIHQMFLGIINSPNLIILAALKIISLWLF